MAARVEIGATGGVIARYLAAMVEKDSAYLAHKPRIAGRPDRASRRLKSPK